MKTQSKPKLFDPYLWFYILIGLVSVVSGTECLVQIDGYCFGINLILIDLLVWIGLTSGRAIPLLEGKQ
jgi:hypothetical protein